jgi:colanic acid biosynthesis glycosyl transferase WcaI
MKIWLITNLYHPDVHGGAALYTDLALNLKKLGHDIRVTTTFPYYPEWRLRTEDQNVGFRAESQFHIPIRRVGIFIPRTLNGLKRVLSDASFLWPVLTRGRFPGWRPELIITAEPMLSQCLALRLLFPLDSRIRRLIIVQDFAADAAIELGLISNPFVAAIARAMERWALCGADLVTTISPAMLTKLDEILRLPTQSGSSKKIRPQTAYVPNWIHSSLATAASERLKQPPQRDKQTLVYSGNVGKKQGLPDFLRLFSATDHDWTLKIYGAGADAEALAILIAELNDSRIELHGILNDDNYLQRLLTATACVVTQKSGFGSNFLPSKVLPCLATATPILAVCDPDSPLGIEIATYKVGIICPPNDKASLAAALNTAFQEGNYARNATQRAKEFSAESVLARFLTLATAQPSTP